MMIITPNGILRTTETLEQLVATHGNEDIKIAPWYCPIGFHNPEYVERRLRLIELYRSCFDDETFHEYCIDQLGNPRSGIPSEEFEGVMWTQMKDYFYGPIQGCPSPNVPQVIAQAWANFIMYQLTKWGDEGSFYDPLYNAEAPSRPQDNIAEIN